MSYNTYVPDDVGNRQSVTDSYGQRAFSYDDTYQLTRRPILRRILPMIR